jgi:hypothetical protein
MVHQAISQERRLARFAISKQMCQAVQEHIEAFGLGPDDLLFPQWMFAYVRSSPIPADDDEQLPPLVSKAGTVYEHGTKGRVSGGRASGTRREMRRACPRVSRPTTPATRGSAGPSTRE